MIRAKKKGDYSQRATAGNDGFSKAYISFTKDDSVNLFRSKPSRIYESTIEDGHI